MQMHILKTDNQLAQAVVPQGSVLTFKTQRDGQIVQRAKLADGSFIDTASGESSGTSTPASQDVTKFQVHPMDTAVAVGDSDSATGLTYSYALQPLMTHKFRIRSDIAKQNNDVVVDWGDGSTTALADLSDSSIEDKDWETDGELIYSLAHTYKTAGRYIVAIHGKDYWGLNHASETTSILSRIFDKDLPLASCVTNLASGARSNRLLKVHFPTGLDLFTKIHNASSLFLDCRNLVSVTNMQTKFRYTRHVQNMFRGCVNMTTCDFQLPQFVIQTTGYTGTFYYCRKLVADIADLLPSKGFDGKKLTLLNCFRQCKSITGTIPAEILWNDLSITQFIGTDCFTDCSDEIRAQAPISWGGTADIVIPKALTSVQTTALVQSKVAQAMEGAGGGSSTYTIADGYGSVTGGYAVRIIGYNSSSGRFTVQGLENMQLDYGKLVAGAKVRISVADDDIGSDSQMLFAQSTIVSVDSTNNYVYTSAWHDPQGSDAQTPATRDLSDELQNLVGFALLRVVDSDRTDSATAIGDKNFVTGIRAAAVGSWNVVGGTTSFAIGNGNTVIGDVSFVQGNSNKVASMGSLVMGGSNTISDSAQMNIVLGGNNIVTGNAFGNLVIGNGNQTTAQSAIFIGNNHISTGTSTVDIGSQNKTGNTYGISIGHRVTNEAYGAVAVGTRGTVLDYAQNKNAFAVTGGDRDDNDIAFIVRSYKAVENPQFNSDSVTDSTQWTKPNPKDSTGQRKYNSQVAYSVTYKGHMLTDTLTIASAGTVQLDHDRYSRWRLTCSGAVTLSAVNWLDGDYGQLVVDTSKQTLTFPSSWISDGADITSSPGQYLIGIVVVGDTVYYRVQYPAVAASTASASSSVQLAIVQGNIDTAAQTCDVRVVTVADDGSSTYTGETVNVRYDFNAPEV